MSDGVPDQDGPSASRREGQDLQDGVGGLARAEPAFAPGAGEQGLLRRYLGRRRHEGADRGTGGREEVDVDAADLFAAELDVADPGAVVAGRFGLAPDAGDDLVGDDRAPAPSANTPAFGVPTLVTSPTAYTSGKRGRQGARVDRDPAVDASSRTRRRPPAPDAPGRRGTGRTAARCRRRARRPCVRRIERAHQVLGHGTRCPRSANAARIACEASGRRRDRHAERASTSAISTASRRPRSRRKSCSSSAVSLGAGGHLNGVDVTPTIAVPAVEVREHVARRRTPRPPSRTRGRASTRPGRGRRIVGRRRAPPPAMSASNAPASVSTRRAAGSIDGDRSPGEAHPGLTMSRVGEAHPVGGRARRTSRRASRTRRRSASAWSIRVTSTSSPSSSASGVDSSSPPNRRRGRARKSSWGTG